VNTYLNKHRLTEYREIFGSETRHLKEELVFEGEKLLTAELEETLRSRGYSREDLLTRALIWICGKKV
jgi:hypothetical protein